MNVDDVLKDEIPTDFTVHDRLEWIFLRQHELAKRYLDIETSNGLRRTRDVPVNLDDRFGQAQLKDFFWRITEELTEAVDANREHPEIPNHVLEELADAMHFLIESYILSGIASTDITNFQKDKGDRLGFLFTGPCLTIEIGAYEVIHAIGKASNCLKQRPWKITHQLVDRKRYRESLIPAIYSLMSIFELYGLGPNEVFEMYYRKSEVNKFRIRTNY